MHGHYYGTPARALERRRSPVGSMCSLTSTLTAPVSSASDTGGGLGVHHGPFDGGARGAPPGAKKRGPGEIHGACPGPRGDRRVAPLRLSNHQPGREGGRGPARHHHRGGALSHEPVHALRFPDVEVPSDAFPSLEQSLDKVSNRYLLVVLAAKRARQLNRGAARPRSTASTRSRRAWPWKRSPTPRSAIAFAKKTPQGVAQGRRASHELGGQHIILGVTGSIAAYKAVLAPARAHARGRGGDGGESGTREQFVGSPHLPDAVGSARALGLFDPQSGTRWSTGPRRAGAGFVVAPATANTSAKAAHGIADDFLTTLLLAARCPILIAPAMDGGMWDHAAVRRTWRRCASAG